LSFWGGNRRRICFWNRFWHCTSSQTAKADPSPTLPVSREARYTGPARLITQAPVLRRGGDRSFDHAPRGTRDRRTTRAGLTPSPMAWVFFVSDFRISVSRVILWFQVSIFDFRFSDFVCVGVLLDGGVLAVYNGCSKLGETGQSRNRRCSFFERGMVRCLLIGRRCPLLWS